MAEVYRLTWEMVKQASLAKYSNADPTFYKNTTQVVPNSQIPDEDWYQVQRETDNPWDQYRTLRQWAEQDREFVRNVRLERMASEPEWVPVDDQAVA